MRPSIAIDMDGVIADVETHFLHWYERDFGHLYSAKDIEGKAEADMFPETGQVYKFARTPGFFETAPVMEGAVEALRLLSENFDLYIVSAAMEFPQSLPEKHAWLAKHFPFISWKQIVFCGDKSIINTDYMIDDHPKNLDFFRGKTIMFRAFHNFSVTNHHRVNNWKEILEFFSAED